MEDSQVGIQVGDVVTLISGGPDMTVNCITTDGIICEWFNEWECHTHTFGFNSLRKIEEKSE
jgi:uncharacterized protein YodC (DUF2158 family)